MKLRLLVAAVLATALLVGCSPDPVSPGGGSSPTPDATEAVTPAASAAAESDPAETAPAATDDAADRYDY